MYTKKLDYVPFYMQQWGNYCGAANAQMALDGYPDTSIRVKYDQVSLFNIMKLHNSQTPPDPQHWGGTDPKGMLECLQSLSSLPVDWVAPSGTNVDAAILFILRSMNRTGIPIPALVDGGDHWVLVVGWQTDVEPTDTNNPKLLHVYFSDPDTNGANHTLITAKTWMKHFRAVDRPGTWSKKYVAIGQGP